MLTSRVERKTSHSRAFEITDDDAVCVISLSKIHLLQNICSINSQHFQFRLQICCFVPTMKIWKK